MRDRTDSEEQQDSKQRVAGGIVLLVIVLILVGIYLFTRSGGDDLTEIAPTIER